MRYVIILICFLNTPFLVVAQDYQPFLIAPFQTGKSIGMEPWLGPKDAFNTLINARTNKGVLEKRQGYQLFATMKHGTTAQTDTAIMGIKTYINNGMPQLLIFDTTNVNRYNPVDASMTDITGASAWLGVNSNNYYSASYDPYSYLWSALDGTTAWVSVGDAKWGILDLKESRLVSQVRGRSNTSADPTDVDIFVSDDPTVWGTAVVEGITTWQDTDVWITIDTTDKIGRYVKILVNEVESDNPLVMGSGSYTILDVYYEGNSLSGSDDDYFSFCNWFGIGYFTNNVDQIYQYNGSGEISRFNVKVNTSGERNHIQTCRYIFVKNDRLLLLDVVEHGNWMPQRCRYSPVLSTDFAAAGAGYFDAPTEERIVSAGWVGPDIVVFFQGLNTGSLWRIRTTGNSDLPLKWEKISSTLSSRAPYSTVEFNDGVAVIGLNNIIFYDGFKTSYLDLDKVRDIVDDFDQTKLKYSTALNVVEDQHVYFTYTTSGEDYPDRILDYNILEQTWAVMKYDVHCLGTFDNQEVPTWANADLSYTGADAALMSAMTLDSRAVLGDPFPFTLMGTRESTVYKMNTGDYDGTDDAAGTIDIDIRSARWNPYVQDNQKVRLGKISFLVDNDENASATISFYKDMRSTAWTTKTLSCDSDDDDCDKFWTTLYTDGEEGDFHSIKISHDARNNRPRIHAIMPFFAPGGELGL